MKFVCVFNHQNVVGETLVKGFSGLLDTGLVVTTGPLSDELVKDKLKEDNIFIFNSKFVNELKEVDIHYSDKVCDQLNGLFRTIKKLIHVLLTEGKRGKFLFITTNPSISHASSFPISPIYDEAVHSLIRSLAKEFKSSQLVFHGICIEPVFEMLEKKEIREYQKKMKVYAMQKRPIKLEALMGFIKNVALTDLGLASGNIFYIAEGLDQVNF